MEIQNPQARAPSLRHRGWILNASYSPNFILADIRARCRVMIWKTTTAAFGPTNLLIRHSRREEKFELEQAFERFDEFQIELARPLARRQVRRLTFLAAGHDMSLFDASYLWLALGLDAALASRDRRLLEAATAAGVDVFDLND